MAILDTSATELLSQMESGALTSSAICEAFLDQIKNHDDAVGAFLHVDPDYVLSQAAAIDKRRAAGERLGVLGGLPVAVKDLLCTAGQATTCGSKMLEKFVPPYDATAIAKLKSADAVILGKTNLDEFAMGGSTENSALGDTRNPWNTDCVPGGSSGGAAACVAARMAPLSLGTDTGGSIRQPAAFCGVVGLKPSYGRVSRYGLVAFASSLDQIGPMANTVEDAALLLSAVAGHDPRDATCAPNEVPDYMADVAKPLEGIRLGIAEEHFAEGLNSEIEAATREAIRVYESLGATVVDIHLPHSKYGIATYYIIAPCEASSNLARYDGVHYGYRTDINQVRADLKAEMDAAESDKARAAVDSPLVRMYRDSRSEGFGPEVKRRIMLGAYALSSGYYDAYYLKALKVRRLIRQDFDKAFEQVDFLIGPVTPTPAFQVDSLSNDPLSMYLGDLYTVSANLAGLPGISVPCGFTSDGLPIGLQLQAKPFDEARLLQAANMYQNQTDWHTKKPAQFS